jgi:hypothetical protein
MDADTWTILGILVNLGVAIGTIFLAFSAYASLKNANKQLVFLKTQLKVMADQDNPFLQTCNVSFDKNKISFKIENIGFGNAYEIGVLSLYQPVTLTNLTTKENSLLEVAKLAFEFEDVIKLEGESQIIKWNKLFNEGKLKKYYPYLWFEINTTKLNDLDSFGNQEIKPDGYVTFAETKYTNLVLSPKAKFEFTCEPHFDAVYMYPKRPRNPIDIYKTQKIGPPAFRYFNTAELIKIMRFNDVSFFNLTFYLDFVTFPFHIYH